MSDRLTPKNASDAIRLQKEMASEVIIHDAFSLPIRHIGGVDVSNTLFDPKKMIYGAVTVFSYPNLELVETASKAQKETFPYITGLLGFREAPVIIDIWNSLTLRPDILLVDGQGISHPRGLGIATHLGILLDIPTIGVAKSILVGEPAGVLHEEAGSYVPLVWKNKQIGIVLRTKKGCNPLIISIGHRICLETALHLVQSCIRGYRLPEPTRQAHLCANQCRKLIIK